MLTHLFYSFIYAFQPRGNSHAGKAYKFLKFVDIFGNRLVRK